jgi:type VI secretion system protein ImpB
MAAKDQSVAPKERINIVYKPATGDQSEQTELPLRILMVGDYTGRRDDTPLDERAPVKIDKENFDEVMAKQDLALKVSVADTLSGEKGATLNVDLKFKGLKDFTPEGVVEQVPELKKLLELRSALMALRGPMANTKAFGKKMEEILKSDDGRRKLMAELGLDK